MTAQKTPPTNSNDSIQTISVIVPANPFISRLNTVDVPHCLTALDVEDLMRWWPGQPHIPERKAERVRAIQRSLDWKRVAQIAAYLLQREIVDTQKKLDQYFSDIYGPKANEPGREWPPRVTSVSKFQRSEYPTFSNVLLHVNGARLENASAKSGSDLEGHVAEPVAEENKADKRQEVNVAKLIFDENDSELDFSVIDGQHRINGAFFAVCLLHEETPGARWEIPAEIFLNLDERGEPPRHQAQIFIDVNFYQKKVDRSLVADLFPTARGRESLDNKERAQDLGRKIMLEIGPLVGMVQIPGIKFGVSGVVTLATLNAAIEDVLQDLYDAGLKGLEEQAEFLAQCLEAWLDATGRKEDLAESDSLDPENVAYQGRAIVSFLTLIPACIWQIQKNRLHLLSEESGALLKKWLRGTMRHARLLKDGKFLAKGDFKARGYLGSGGLARFRDMLWIAAESGRKVSSRLSPERLSEQAAASRGQVRSRLKAARSEG